MKLISLTQNKKTLVDDSDYELMSKYKWHLHINNCKRNYYAEENILTIVIQGLKDIFMKR